MKSDLKNEENKEGKGQNADCHHFSFPHNVLCHKVPYKTLNDVET